MSESNMNNPDAVAASASTADGETHPHRYTSAMANTIEEHWQARWEADDTFRASNPSDPGFDPSRPKYFCLDMFPYPSGAGLHVGHPEGYTATDIICRYKRMRGFNVLHPMGFDAFGLPAEQYAIQTGVHPAITTRKAIDTFRKQLKRFGFSYDWSREFATIDEDYYKWTQWIWLKAYNAWFDTNAQQARPIDDLIAEFASGGRPVRLNPHAAEYKGAGDIPGGTPIGSWSDLGSDIQRMITDSYRLAYLGKQTVNWCPKLGTVLANEEVIDGRSERGGYPIHRLPLEQWMFRITAYADRLLGDLDKVDWPSSTHAMQREWIGRSEGAEIDFKLVVQTDQAIVETGESLRVFTTRPDTIFGATYMVVAPEHPLVENALAAASDEADRAALSDYVEQARNRSEIDRMADSREKTGVFSGLHAINPATGELVPVWVADYVLMGYGTGAIMAVPGQDQRDWDFAKTFDLSIVRTVQPPTGFDGEAYAGAGLAINSANDDVSLDGLDIPEAKSRIIAWLRSKAAGTGRVNYKLRDWLFSRQRYWGEPFPVVFDAGDNHYPVDPASLPVALPEMDDYEPIESDTPQPPLGKATEWVYVTAGEAGVSPDVLPPDTPVRRETNTMPGWAGSCWYYLRFCDPRNNDRFVGRSEEQYWMVSQRGASDGQSASDSPYDEKIHHVGGVDLYVGGAEHAVLHLLYARFWHKILFDLGEVSTPEPMGKLFHQGMIQSFVFERADRSLVPLDEVIFYSKSRAPQPSDKSIKCSYASGDTIRHGHPDELSQVVLEALEAAEGSEVAFEARSQDWGAEIGPPLKANVGKMSKSLKNVVNPDDIIAEYGADTFRLYEMYMGPLEASKPWNTRDIAGPFRFLQRAWRLAVDEASGELKVLDASDPDVEKTLHRTIAKVGNDIERLAFNTAIAAMMEFVNVATSSPGLTREQLERFALTLAPFAPHMAEELWSKLGRGESLAYAPWPCYDESMLVDDEVEIAVQIMGKVRARVVIPADADQAATEQAVMTNPDVLSQLEGKTVRKVIVVPGKIVNIVAT